MSDDLDEIERLAREATPGEWLQARHVGEPRAIVAAARPHDSLLAVDSDGMAIVDREADAAFVAHMHPARVLALVARLRRAERVVEAATYLISGDDDSGVPPMAWTRLEDALAALSSEPSHG